MKTAVRQPVFLQSLPGRLEQEWEILRHGQTEARAGDANEIRALSQNDLLQQWRQLAAAPVTYYLVSNQPPEKLKPLLIQTPALAWKTRARATPSSKLPRWA